MTDLQKSYREVIVSVDGRKGITFEKAIEGKDSISGAGMAIAVSVLEDGNIKLNHLTKRLPDFRQTSIRTALSNLRKNGYFVFDRKEKLYRVALTSEQDEKDGVSATDGVVWALLGAVSLGFIKRV